MLMHALKLSMLLQPAAAVQTCTHSPFCGSLMQHRVLFCRSMLSCLHLPSRRPTFADLLPQLQEMLQAARQAAPPQPLPSRVASARSSAELPRNEGSPAMSPSASAAGLPPAAPADAAAAAADGS